MTEWRFPGEVKGWLSEAEGRKLAELARGKRVLEIGSYQGRSTVCLGQVARSLDCIDPMTGLGGTDTPEGNLAALRLNLQRYGVSARLHVGTTADVGPDLEGPYDLIFVDGAHDARSVAEDIRQARRLLAPGGLVAFHDYRSKADPDVAPAVDGLLAGGAELVDLIDSLAVLRLTAAPEEKPVVFLGMPRRGNQASYEACRAFFGEPTLGECSVVLASTKGSILDHNFNFLWAEALNRKGDGVTHFAMIHDDIGPAAGWLDVLLRELRKSKADVISAVVPIKDARGITSTGVETDSVWLPRRLTMREVHKFPQTFGDAEAGGPLLLNTGLWVCDLRRPFWEEPEPLYFQTVARIGKLPDGKWQAQVRSEDWEFSRAARARGARLAATRAVSLNHEGETLFPSNRPWGKWQTDEVFTAKAPPVGAPEVEAEPCLTPT